MKNNCRNRKHVVIFIKNAIRSIYRDKTTEELKSIIDWFKEKLKSYNGCKNNKSIYYGAVGIKFKKNTIDVIIEELETIEKIKFKQ